MRLHLKGHRRSHTLAAEELCTCIAALDSPRFRCTLGRLSRMRLHLKGHPRRSHTLAAEELCTCIAAGSRRTGTATVSDPAMAPMHHAFRI